MANEEHVEILRKGVEVWNEWREDNPEVDPDLRSANLSEADLHQVDLHQADLSNAQLGGANLSEAALHQADFNETNLSKADLSYADLSGANLRDAYLREADLSGAALSRANLLRADLSRTNLSGAILCNAILCAATLRNAAVSGADLSGADLSGAILREADLSNAQLGGANLSEADFSNTIFIRATVASTTFATVQLSNVKGLESVRHSGPSSIGTDTLRLCEGKLPEKFLKGCGLADWEIEAARLYDPNLSADAVERIIYKIHDIRFRNPIQFYSSFISYSHTDEAFAQRLHDQLQERGVRCWLDKKKMKIGQKILSVVLDAIRVHDRVVLCCSRASLTSNWVQTEIEETFAKEKKDGREILLPLNLDGYLFDGWKGPLAVEVRKRLAADFTDTDKDEAKYKEQFERLVSALTDSKKK